MQRFWQKSSPGQARKEARLLEVSALRLTLCLWQSWTRLVASSMIAKCALVSKEVGDCTANLRTKILDFRGFDSRMILILRGWILTSTGKSPECLSQAISAGRILVGRLGVWRLFVGGTGSSRSLADRWGRAARRPGAGSCYIRLYMLYYGISNMLYKVMSCYVLW